jgi:hypothetical protein
VTGLTVTLLLIPTLPITVLDGGAMVILVNELEPTTPVLVGEPATRARPKTPNLGPPLNATTAGTIPISY